MNIGICGGTFDPFHCGHLEPILSVREAMQWDRVSYVPAFVQPFKADRVTASAYHRFAMTVLGTAPYPALYPDPRELERGAVSYTVDTLEELRREHPHASLDWIIGDDNLAQLEGWRSLERILELANFTVLTRLSDDEKALAAVPVSLRERIRDAAQRASHGNIVFARNAAVVVSSTEVRARIGAGQPVDGLVPAPVSHYIHHHELYRKARS
ncbi:MAG: nicotinate-nucleotide adenylyltransferase [Acidobacteriota bacterium]